MARTNPDDSASTESAYSADAALEGEVVEDWAGRATATVVGYVDTVRSATTGKALSVSRLAVYGLAIALVGVVMGIILLIILVRLVGSIFAKTLPFVSEGEIWPAYFLLGAIFLFIGRFVWRKRPAA